MEKFVIRAGKTTLTLPTELKRRMEIEYDDRLIVNIIGVIKASEYNMILERRESFENK